jgi:hypothetical protein
MMGLRPFDTWVEIGLQNYGYFMKKRRKHPKKLPRTANLRFFLARPPKYPFIPAKFTPGRPRRTLLSVDHFNVGLPA